MPHREKIAWLLLITMLVCYVPYFTLVSINPPAPDVLPNLPQLWLLAATGTAHALIQGLGRLWFRIRAPGDARAPADERDLAIERRSTTVAYYVLMAGMILVAETFHYGIAVWSYRRSAA